MADYEDRFWSSADGLQLHYRDYPGPAARPALLCLHGLTRNARDFAALADRYAGARRVLCPDLRGRGVSAYAADAATYHPAQYVADVLALLDQARVERFVAIGTSLGGLMTMGLALTCPARLAGAVLNDVGPVLEPAGLARIAGYVGRDERFADWDAAAAHIARLSTAAFPRRDAASWHGAARRVMVERADGVRFDYDPRIAAAFTAPPAVPVDLWPGFAALGGRPVLLLRGMLSDLVTAESFAVMQARLPGAEAVTVADVGHAPELDEPQALAAIDRLLARVG